MAQRDAMVSKGAFYPSTDHIKAVVRSLQSRIKKDPKVAKLFKKDPRRTLANLGMNEDVQTQLLKEMGLRSSARGLGWCICTECCITCWTTGCCFTQITIVVD